MARYRFAWNNLPPNLLTSLHRVLKLDLLHELAADQGPVSTAEVGQPPPAITKVDPRVLTRDRRLRNADAGARIPANDQIAF